MEDTIRQSGGNRLAGGLKMLTSIVNLRFPSETADAVLPTLDPLTLTPEQYAEWRKSGVLPETRYIVTRPNGQKDLVGILDEEEFLKRVRAITIRFWPELWEEEPGLEPPLQTIHLMRHYLRRFWVTSDEWYIYRARECHQRRRVFRETRRIRESYTRDVQTKEGAFAACREIDWHMQRALDKPPQPSDFEKALFKLLQKARHPSTKPMKCGNEHCTGDLYFLKSKTHRKYCSAACSAAVHRAKKLRSWHEHKTEWRSK